MAAVKRQRTYNADVAHNASFGDVVGSEDEQQESLLDHLRSMSLTGRTFPTQGDTVSLTVEQFWDWTRPYHFIVPHAFKADHECMRLVGLEKVPLPFSDSVLHEMRECVSGLWQNVNFGLMNGVTLSINRGEARVLCGWKLLTCIIAFIDGNCNMSLSRQVTLDTGRKVGEIPYRFLPDEDKRFFLDTPIRFFCIKTMNKEAEDKAKYASWDGFGVRPD